MPWFLAAAPALSAAGSSTAAAGTAAASAAAAGAIGGSAAVAGISAVDAGVAAATAAAAGGSSLSLITAGATAISGITSAVGSFAQGQYQKKAASAQVAELNQQSTLDKTQAGAEIATQDYKALNILGKIAASAAGSGVTPEGSPELVSRTSSQEQRISDTYLRYSGQLSSMRDIYKAALAKNQGQEQYESGLVGTGGGLLTSGLISYGTLSGEFAVPYIGG